ncbi:MAG: TolC family protein [candidate division KSB1 bacterium]|nr:TolC family protein [candidate division KSB1 bacterium]
MKRLTLMFLIFPFTLLAQDRLTVEDAIEIGLKYNYDIRIARNEAAIAEKNAGYGTAGFLPTLDASGGYQLVNSDQETNSPIGFGESDTRSLTGSIALNWTLFDGFSMFAERDRYNALARLGEYQARYSIENTVVAILRAYYNLVQQEQLLDVSTNARDISKTRYQKERVRQELGSASSTDLLNSQVSLNNDEATLINQELLVSNARKDLNILLGRDASAPTEVDRRIGYRDLEYNMDDLCHMAKRNNSYLMLMEKNRLVAEKDVAAAKSSFLPRLSLNASYGYTDSETERAQSGGDSFFPPTVDSQNKDAVVGMTLSFNLFNGFRDRINMQTARLAAENQRLAYEYAERELEGLVREQYDTFRNQLRLIELEDQNVVAARRNLELQQDRYAIGAASSLEFRDAQVNLIRAQTALIRAQYQSRITRLEIEQLIGNLQID